MSSNSTATSSGQISGSTYAERRKEVLQLINQLRGIGAQSDLDLPRIAVIGNQSAGKSSVVEAISGITVPRDAGTCTRCPMECRLASSTAPWECRLFIRWEFEDDNKPRDHVEEIPFGSLITDPTDVELYLRRAQAAILNPDKASDSFLHLSREELSASAERDRLRFSRNVVCLDISGPGLTDLSFIDLPGLVQNADAHIVALVESLVISHIQGNTLILVALPMTDDIENQKAVQLARIEDPNGRRTIGVMTKPDMLTAGATKARDLWLDVIEGRRHSLLHGYYCTRQPNDEERSKGITATEARQAEEYFFKAHPPWSRSTQKGRFGTRNLVSSLSTLLTQIINDALPKIQSDAQKGMEACIKELKQLPVAIEQEPATYVLQLLTGFSADIRRFVSGDANSSTLLQKNRQTFKDLKKDIRRTAPNFMPYLNCTTQNTRWENHFGDDEDEPESAFSGMQTRKGFYLEDMRKHIEKSITRELPDNVPFDAKVRLIQEFQNTWPTLSEDCFDDVRKSMDELLTEQARSSFGRFDGLHHQIRAFTKELTKMHSHKCSQYIVTFLSMQRTPFTQNTHYLQKSKDEWMAKYKDARAGKTNEMLDPTAGAPSKRRKAKASNGGSSPFSFATSMTASASSSKSPFTFGPTTAATSATATPTPANGGFFGLGAPKPSAETPLNGTSAFGSKPALATPASTHGATTPASPRATDTSKTTPVVALPVPLSSGTVQAGAGPTNQTSDSDKVIAALAALADLGYTGLRLEDLGKLNPPDEYETELEVMAEVRAFFQVAYKRVIDDVPQLIDLLFVKAIAEDLQHFLIGKFGLGTEQANARCSAFLAEDPLTVARRSELIGRKERLQAVMEQLYGFGV